MKRIITNGITDLEPLPGSSEWYIDRALWTADQNKPVAPNRVAAAEQLLRLVQVAAGIVSAPIPVCTKPGQYLGRPTYHDGQVVLLMVDFPKEEIHILAFHETNGTTQPLAVLPLSIADDCCNLMLEIPPLMLIRSGHNNRIQLLWPEHRDFAVEENEYFAFLNGNRLYTTVWYEDPNYREELLERDYDTGEVLERIPGSLRRMPDGQKWLLV